VASMVVWEEGKMRKGEYRSFNIRDLTQPDDFASMRQAVERRYRRRLEEVGAMPDLILIDGGRGQLNAALDALAVLGVEDTPICGLAKREEEIYLTGLPGPLKLPRDDYGLRLLQQIRDEAHRFAVSRHRARRSARTLHSRLDELSGIGPRRRKLLIQQFGSVEGVRQATLEDLQGSLGQVMGRKIFDQLHAEPVPVPAPEPAPAEPTST
jgi:excinuclease ABC subunit C